MRRPAVALIATSLAATVLGAVPATAVATGGIEGDVTSDGVAVTDDLRVIVYPAGDGQEQVEETSPDEFGHYSFPNLAPGSYDVTFQSPDGTYAYEAWKNATRYEDATAVPVADTVVPDIDADLDLTGQVSGTVTDEALRPLANASVIIYEARTVAGGGSDWVEVDAVPTNLSGDYRIDRLAPGDYRVEFDAEGYQPEYFRDVPSLEGSEPVSVVGGDETADIDAALTADAVIRGRVTDAQDRPLAGAGVYVEAVESEDGTWVNTDDLGNWFIEGLPADRYTVFFEYDDDWETTEGYLSEYYKNAARYVDATPVVVKAGDDEGGIDAKLVAGEHDPVLLPYLDPAVAPVISGDAQVGATLSATSGTFVPAPSGIEYSWYRNGEWIEGATASTYVPTAADLGAQLTVQTAATRDGYERTYSAVSVPTAAVVAAPVVVPPVVAPPVVTPPVVVTPPAPVVDTPAALAAIVKGLDVAGKPKVGTTLKVKGLDKVLRASTSVRYSFQWYAGSKKIKKATKSKLKVVSSMKGTKLSVKVSAKAGSSTKSVKIKVGKVR